MNRRSFALRSPKLVRRRRKIIIFRTLSVIIVCAVLGTGVYFLLHLKAIAVKFFDVVGAVAVPIDSVKKISEDETQGNYLFFFPKSNIFLYPQKQLEQKLLSSFPRLRTVAVSFENLTTLKVDLTERTPEAVWCGEAKRDAVAASCFFLDKNGFVFDQAPNFSKPVYFTFHGFLEGESPIGKNYFSVERFSRLRYFADQIKKLGFAPVSAHFIGNDDFEFYLQNGPRIIFTDKGDLVGVLDNLEAILGDSDFSGPGGRSINSVDYFDLRFGDKAFYKLK